MKVASARIHEGVFALTRIIEARKEKKDKAANMLTKVKKLYELAFVWVVSHLMEELSELPEIIDTLTDELEGKNLEIRTMLDRMGEATVPRNEVRELRRVIGDAGAIVFFMNGLRKDVSAVIDGVAEFLPTLHRS